MSKKKDDQIVDAFFRKMDEVNRRRDQPQEEQQPQQQPQSPGWLQRLQDATRQKPIKY